MKVIIKEFQSGGLPNGPSTIHFSCDIKLSPEYFGIVEMINIWMNIQNIWVRW
jgi:hypothetical protein